MPLNWANAAAAASDYAVTVTDAQLATAQQECLRAKGLAIDTPAPPTTSFREGVVLQALANRQAGQADVDDEIGGPTNGVRVRPFAFAIMSKLIIAHPDPDDPTRDTGRIGSMIG